jgi:DNA-binding CsgD family transcriptional regulator
MELLEREPLLASLDARLDRAAAGAGSLVLLAGEAGIGKTSLARAFCDRHQPDARRWWGACDALSTPRPLGPLYDIARTAGGELAGLMASDASRHHRFGGFLDALSDPRRPVIAVIEDVHWADEATLDLLIFIGRRVADTGAVIVVTYRDEEIGPDHPLRPVLGRLATLPAVDRLRLPRLTEPAVATLAADHPADAAQVYRVTGGNPFFVTEILAAGTGAGAGTVPETVSDAVLARAAQLPPPARAALDAAAAVPDRAEVALVRAITGGDITALEQCVQAGLLLFSGRSVRFRHELARLAVARDIPPTRLPDLHARALAYLAAQSGAAPARLAYHAEQADDREAVLRYAPAAAAEASRLGAHREAADHYRRALRFAEVVPAADRAELLDRYADECTAIDHAADAIAAAGEAVTIWQGLGEVDRAATRMASRAYLLWGSGRGQEAREAVRAAVTLLERRPPGVALATAYTYTAHLHLLAREIPAAVTLGDRAVALAEQYGDVPLLARALNIVGAAQWFADPAGAEATLARALEVAHLSGDDTIVGSVLRMLGSGAGEVRRYQTADHWLREGMRWCQEHDLDIHGDYCLAWAARSAFEQGRWSEAAALAGEAAGRPTEHAPSRITALTTLGRLRVRRGDPDPDTPLAEAWQLAERTGDLQRLWPAAAGRAEAAWLAGQPERIPDLVAGTYRLAVRLRQQWPTGELAFWLWRAGAMDTAPDHAIEPYALHINGELLAAAAAWDQIGCPYEAALARADSTEPDQLATALESLAALGARPAADLVAATLRAQGVRRLPRRPTRATLANPAGLTAREVEVLRLLVAGQSNADIATTLHISRRTAGHHVSAILGKLGVHTRRDAARAARDWGLS